MTGVEFGDGSEPWSVTRGHVTRWLHCRVDVDALPDSQRDELAGWLTDRGMPISVLLVTRGDGGYQVHTSGGTSHVDLVDLPSWLQRPDPPARAQTRRVQGRDRADRSRPA